MSRSSNERRGASGFLVDVVRSRIISGVYSAGSPVRDGSLADEFGVSRNTARESLSLLRYAGLLSQAVNRGFFVRSLDIEEIEDLYRTRRVFELRAIQSSSYSSNEAIVAVEDSVARSEVAPSAEPWSDAQQHSMLFHRSLVGLLCSPILDEFYGNLLARLSATFARSSDPGRYHSDWAEPHREIIDNIRSGDRAVAEAVLLEHLQYSEVATINLIQAVTDG